MSYHIWFLLFFSLVSCLSTQAVYEEPLYTVTHSFDNIEIRQYKRSLIAEVRISGNRKQSSYSAFRELARYITGKNTPTTQTTTEESVTIQMTQPVAQQQIDESLWRVYFYMPSEWTLKTLPRPINEDIKIRQLNQRQIAAIQFSGRWTDKNFNIHQEKLEKYLIENGYSIRSKPILAYYNSPFVPWFMRRNEVMFIVSK